jgi:hypothetical protein
MILGPAVRVLMLREETWISSAEQMRKAKRDDIKKTIMAHVFEPERRAEESRVVCLLKVVGIMERENG